MNAAELLIMAAAKGVQLALDGERLTWNADHQPPTELLVEIKAHRQTIIAALTAANDLSIAATALPDELQHPIHTAATAALEWVAARDQYITHLMACRACYAPTGRHCVAGAGLRQQYDQTPMEQRP